MVAVARAERFSPNQKKKIIYKDLFSATMFNKDTKDVDTVENEDSVKQAILNILLTSRGERVFNNNFGSDINHLLFENITPQTTTTLVTYIRSAIENYEPRAKIVDVVAAPVEEQNAYAVTVVFRVINKTEPISIDFLLNRVR